MAALRTPDGTLRAATSLRIGRAGGLHATADAHAAHWGVLADQPDDRDALWRALAAVSYATVTLAALTADADAPAAHAALTSAGRRVHRVAAVASPHATLPESFDDLLAARSANLRSQVRRREKALGRIGTLRLRTLRGGEALGAPLESFLRVEAAGWKAAARTAILVDPRAGLLYRDFARLAAERGWLCLHLLELDGRTLAGDLSVRFGDTEFLLKTGYDEAHASLSPGLVLRAAVLRTAIEDGVRHYDFLGGPDPYKLRWTDEVRPRVTVRGFRGGRGVPEELWWRAARPTLARARHGVVARVGR